MERMVDGEILRRVNKATGAPSEERDEVKRQEKKVWTLVEMWVLGLRR
jgi:hypothetical protein